MRVNHTDRERANHCPVCSKDRVQDDALCKCGYSFTDKVVTDWGGTRALVEAMPREAWPMRCRIIRGVLQNSGTSGTQTAKHLGHNKMYVSRANQLANALDRFPELATCPNEDSARRKLRTLEANNGVFPSTSGAFESEEDLQKYLQEHWSKTELGKEWVLQRKGHVRAAEIGIMDLLAKHQSRPVWLVVELKVLKTSDEVLGQILRYMGWVKRCCAGKDESVEGLVIASCADIQTLYGLECLPNVRMMRYRRLPDSLELCETSLIEFLIAGLSPDQRKELIARSSSMKA
ncbi:MAG: hypothetical protein KGJ97_08410 [Xanthomonadaceae bacterium]|nr:hypothetical protein [Xanthomonadaceae bacterium]MDE3072848.1 hypothetical protein [Pseudomonadota bacterium]